MQQCVVWWIKRDARLTDNPALHAAIATGLPVVPLFVFEPSVLGSAEYSSTHAHAQSGAIRYIREELKVLGGNCLVFHCECEHAFTILSEKILVERVFSAEETGPETTFSRDRRMGAWFKKHCMQWTEVTQGGTVRNSHNREHQAVLRLAHYAEAPLAAPAQLLPLPKELCVFSSQSIPSLEELQFEPGRHQLQRISEGDAASTLVSFLGKRGSGYRYRISSPATAFNSGSRLSAHLAWGTISARSIFHQLREVERLALPESSRAKDLQAFRARLHWRDHFMQRLESAPWMEHYPLNPLFSDLPYRDNSEEYLEAWLTGRTGFPMIDACMRCLSFTGFLNFRMRAMVTSFATHALRLDWKAINAPLGALMYDYEPGIHISQVQMQAGVTGINALRVYSPAKQLIDQDPSLLFVRKWIPEIANIKNEDVFLAKNGHVPGYIVPIVSFADETKLMKDALYARKKSPDNASLSSEIVQKFGSKLGRRKRVSRKKQAVIHTVLKE